MLMMYIFWQVSGYNAYVRAAYKEAEIQAMAPKQRLGAIGKRLHSTWARVIHRHWCEVRGRDDEELDGTD